MNILREIKIISSKKEKESNTFLYDTQYGVYKIEYGEKKLPFQKLI